jgi:predicted TIM-barrel fold metal-dependent hydrolase
MSLVVDGHCHLGIGHEYRQSAEELLAAMDTLGVDRAVVCPVDRCIAVDNLEGNNTVLQAARHYPDRFYPFATANPWYGARALAELRRAVGEGARGIKLHPPLQGFMLCDDLVFPVIELAGEFGIPVFIHTGTPAYSQPTQLAELAQRYPEVPLIMGHMGSTDFKFEAIPSALMSPNIYLDTSWILPALLTQDVQTVGAERVLFSSDSPIGDLRVEMGCRKAAGITPEERAKVMGVNMLRLLGDSR